MIPKSAKGQELPTYSLLFTGRLAGERQMLWTYLHQLNCTRGGIRTSSEFLLVHGEKKKKKDNFLDTGFDVI